MDSLAYSVMLEIKTNTSNLNKDLQKSLSIANDYNKQVQKNYNANTKAVKGYIDAHTGLNKVYKEELSWLEKIGHAAGSALGFIISLPIQAAKAIAGMALSVIKATATAISASISYIDKYIEQAIDRFDSLLEEYRFANIQAAGGVSLLHNQMTELMMVTGATFEEAKKIAFGLANAGFRAKEMGKDFYALSETLWGFERITGVSAETSAGLAKSLDGVGFSAEGTRKMFVSLAKQAYASSLNASELTEVMNNLREEMYQLEFAFDQEAITKYSKALGELAGAAKMVGVNVSKATQLMSELNRNPMKFVVSLGSDAFYKSAGENMETLISNLDNIRNTLEGIPPGLKPQLLQDIYGIDSATFKMLESVEEFRKKYPAIKKWGEMLEEANSSLSRMYQIVHSKIMAVFERLAQRFALVRIDFFKAFTKDIPEKLQNLFAAIINLVDRIFDKNLVDSWGKSTIDWVRDINRWIGNLIDGANRWITALSKPENIAKIQYYISEISRIITEKIIPGVKEFAGKAMNFAIKALEVSYDIISTILSVSIDILDIMWDIGSALWDIGKAAYTVGKFILDWIIIPFIKYNPITFMLKGFYEFGKTIMWLGELISDYISGPIRDAANLFGWLAEKVGLGGGKEIPSKIEIEEKGAVSGFLESLKTKLGIGGAAKAEDNKLLSGFTDLGGIMKDMHSDLSKIGKDSGLTLDKGNKIAEETNRLLKNREEIAESPLSKMGFALRDIGKKYYDPTTKSMKTIDLNKEIENQINHLRTMARWRGEEFNEEKARKKLEGQVSEEYSRMFGKAFKHIKDSDFTKESGLEGKALNEATLKWTKSILAMNSDQLKENEMFKKLNKEQQNAVRGANDLFFRLKEYGNSDIDYLEKSANFKNEFVQKIFDNDKKLADQAKKKAEEEAKRLKESQKTEQKLEEIKKKEMKVVSDSAENQTKKMAEQEALDAKSSKDITKPGGIFDTITTAAMFGPFAPMYMGHKAISNVLSGSEIQKGAAAGAKSAHVSVAAPSSVPEPVKIDKESLGELGEMVAVNKEQLGILGSIDKKIGTTLYNRNDPPYNEVTSTIWGS